MTAPQRREKYPPYIDAAVATTVAMLRFDVERDDRAAPQPYVSLRRDEVAHRRGAGPTDADAVQRRPRIGWSSCSRSTSGRVTSGQATSSQATRSSTKTGIRRSVRVW